MIIEDANRVPWTTTDEGPTRAAPGARELAAMTAGNRILHLWILVILLAVGLAARFIGLGNGLPDVVGPDEGFEIHRALELGTGEIDFDRISKGGFFYLLFVEYGVYFVWLRAAGEISSTAEFAELFAVDATPFWMIARATHAAVGVLVILWTFILGRRAFGAEAGLIGASIVAISPLCVTRSHYVGVDLPMTLLVLMTMQLILYWSRPESRCRPIATGFLFGASLTTKITAIILVLPLALANWLRFRRESLRRALLGREVLIAYLTGVIVFMVGQPGFVVRFGDFVRAVGHTLLGIGSPAAAAVYQEAGEQANLWALYLKWLVGGMGTPFVLLGVAGLGLAFHRRTRADMILLALVVPYYALIAGAQTTHLYYPRYVLPLVPFLGLLAGRLLWGAVCRLSMPARAHGLVAATLSVVCLLPSLVETSRWCLRQTREDTHVLTRRWFEENVPAGSSVFLVGNPVSPSAPNLSLPLRNSDSNVAALLADLYPGEPRKAKFLEVRQKALTGPRYDLRTVRHFEPVASLEDYRRAGVRYFVLSGIHFDPNRPGKDTKHPQRVRTSRAALYDSLNNHPDATRIFEIDPELDGRPGRKFEIYRLLDGGADDPGGHEGSPPVGK